MVGLLWLGGGWELIRFAEKLVVIRADRKGPSWVIGRRLPFNPHDPGFFTVAATS
jgi:hypothetical protein